MARRSHLTEIGCIACDELAELGAGEREGGRDDSTIPPSSRPFTHSPSPSPSRPQPVPSSSAPPKICPSLSLPDNCPRLLPLRRPPRSRPRYLHGSHPRLLPMPRTDQETASKRGLVALCGLAWGRCPF
ncbi:unnamed protein product [Musa hybrid cultivar]